ncbi:hypothetical protein ACVLVH_001239 [Kluyvera sp. 1366]
MAINFRQVPTALKQPELPRWWIWLLLLALFLVSGTAYQMSVNMENKAIDAEAFWEKALVIPAAIWLTLLVLRMVYYSCDIATVDKLNAKREKAIQQQVQLGQRYLNILDVSLHTALRFPDDQDGKKQWQAIQQKQQALKTQPSWQSERGIRHSRLPDAQLSCREADAVLLGRTAVLPQLSASHSKRDDVITIQLGRYERVRVNTSRIETDEEGDYRW